MDKYLKAVDPPYTVTYHFNSLRPFVTDLDTRKLLEFINQICDPNRLCSLSAADSLTVLQTAVEVHGPQIAQLISQIVSAIIGIMSSVNGSLHTVGCSKVINGLCRYVIDPLGTKEEKTRAISSVCSPFSCCLMSSNESLSSGTALCLTAIIQSNSWRFASHELVNDLSLKVTAAIEELHYKTDPHLGLVVALLKQNHSTLEPYGRSLNPSPKQILSDNHCSTSYSGQYPLMREQKNGEELTTEHHSLFKCSLDNSEWTSLRDFAVNNKETLVLKEPTPGSAQNHTSETTCNELKLIIRRSYTLLENLNNCGLTFAGNLSANYFVIDKYGNLKFDKTAKHAVKKLEDEGVDQKNEDRHGFVHMIKREIFEMKQVPGDLGTWLFLVDGCDKTIEEVMKHNTNLMDEHQIASTFTSLFDTLLDLEKNDQQVYDAVMKELSKNPTYSNWQVVVNYNTGNTYLRDTVRYRIHKKKRNYDNDPRGLLLMLRNSRQHSAKFKESDFARIVAEHFENLLSDFQLAMHRQKCLAKLNLRYSMG